MGNKNKLLNFIIPHILNNSSKNDVICELMAGTSCVSYALKNKRKIYTNDIQYYSYIISNALIKNNSKVISSESAINDLEEKYQMNLKSHKYNFFEKNYSDTYFSSKQCIEIDSIRYAINYIKDIYIKSLYLVALMHAMCVCEATSGHFAQYLPSDHPRLKKIKCRSIWDEFLKKCNNFKKIVFSKYENKCFNLNYMNLIELPEFDDVSLVYIDPPYTGEQYSRFYHVLETICKYDNPKLEFKGLYRTDRFTSNFSLKTKAFDEFEKLFSALASKNKKIVLSYSTKGLIKEYEMEYLLKKYFKYCETERTSYNHSTQGKGSIHLEELLFIAYN